MSAFDLHPYIRDVPDFPKEGIVFKDITPLLSDAKAFAQLIDHLQERYSTYDLTHIVGIDARGFIFGSALAYALGVGFVPVRKKGKLPASTFSHSYALEYGSDTIEIHQDAFGETPTPRVLLIDDLIATGGTAHAAFTLIERAGGICVECCCMIALRFLDGAARLEDRVSLYTLMEVA